MSFYFVFLILLVYEKVFLKTKRYKMNKWEIIENIGGGSFGKVYKAKYRDQLAVIKFLNKENKSNKRESFENEVCTW